MHRKDLKGQLIQLSHSLHEKQLTNENRAEITKKIQILKQEIKDHDNRSRNDELINERRRIINENSDLKEIFGLFWRSIRGFVDSKTKSLTEDGYVKLNVAMQYALTLHIDEKDALKNAKADWLFDSKIYNNTINEISFTDILYDLIETSTDVMDHVYYSAFTWTLQNEILDLTKKPPKVKARREIQCIVKPNCEAEMIMNYLQRKVEIKAEIAERSKLLSKHIAEEVVDVEQELRLGARKEGLQSFNDNQMNMLEALGHAHESKMKTKARQRAEGSPTDIYSDTDSEGGSRGDASSFSDDSDMEYSKSNKMDGNGDGRESEASTKSLLDKLVVAGARKLAPKPRVNRQSRSYFLFQSVGEGADTGSYVPASSFVKKYKPFVYEPHQGKKKKDKVVYEGPSYLWPTSTHRKKARHYKKFKIKLDAKHFDREYFEENMDEEEEEEEEDAEESMAVEATRSSLLSPITEYSKPLTPIAIPSPKYPELKPSFKAYNTYTIEGRWDKRENNNKQANQLQKLFRGSRFHSRELPMLLDSNSKVNQYLDVEGGRGSLSDAVSVRGYSDVSALLNSDNVGVVRTPPTSGLSPVNSREHSSWSSTNESVFVNNNDDVIGKVQGTMSSSIQIPKKAKPTPVYNSNYERSLRYSRYRLDELIQANILKTRSAITTESHSSEGRNDSQANESEKNNCQTSSSKVQSSVSSSLSLPLVPMDSVAWTSGGVDAIETDGPLIYSSEHELHYHNIRTKYLLDELSDTDTRATRNAYLDSAGSRADLNSELSPVVSKAMNSLVYVTDNGVDQVQTVVAEANSVIDIDSRASKTKSALVNEDLYLLSCAEPLFFKSKSDSKGRTQTLLEPLLSPISRPRNNRREQKVAALGSTSATKFPYQLKEMSTKRSKKKELTTTETRALVAIREAVKVYEKDRGDIMQLCVHRASIMEATRFIQQQAMRKDRAEAEESARMDEEPVQPFDKDVINSYMEMSLNGSNKVNNMHTVSLNKGLKPVKKTLAYRPGNGDESSALSSVSVITEPLSSIDAEFNDVKSKRAYNKIDKRVEPLSAKDYERVLAAADTVLYQQ